MALDSRGQRQPRSYVVELLGDGPMNSRQMGFNFLARRSTSRFGDRLERGRTGGHVDRGNDHEVRVNASPADRDGVQVIGDLLPRKRVAGERPRRAVRDRVETLHIKPVRFAQRLARLPVGVVLEN